MKDLIKPAVKNVIQTYQWSQLETEEDKLCWLLDITQDSAHVIDRDDFYLIYTMDDKYPVFAHHSEFGERLGMEKPAITVHLPSITYMSSEPDDIVGDIIHNEIHELSHWAAEHQEYPEMGNHPEGWNEVVEDVVQHTYDEDYEWKRTTDKMPSARKMISMAAKGLI